MRLAAHYGFCLMLNSLRFLREFILHPGQTGALAPSSRRLGEAMVRALGPVEPGKLIIELGPGTGSFTQVIRDLLPNNPVLAIERNEHFAAQLRERFPDMHIAEGCASKIREAISASNEPEIEVGGVISGLPLLSLPKELIADIFASLKQVLPEDGTFVNFTYSKRSFKRRLDTPLFKIVASHHVLLNLPPASVMVLRPVEGACAAA
jgi:phosphatidylethanolamine/phosphatidyl-N-methylethanolamine N-methyltransferase